MIVVAILMFIMAATGVVQIIQTGADPDVLPTEIIVTIMFTIFGIMALRKYQKNKVAKAERNAGMPTKQELKLQKKNKRTEHEITEYRNGIQFIPKKSIGISIWFSDDEFVVPRFDKKQLVVDAVYKIDDVIGYEIIENGTTVTKGGLGRAVAGGVLFGGVGAIVGGVTGDRTTTKNITSLKLKLTMNDIMNPVVYVEYMTKYNMMHKLSPREQIQETVSIFQIMQNRKEQGN